MGGACFLNCGLSENVFAYTCKIPFPQNLEDVIGETSDAGLIYVPLLVALFPARAHVGVWTFPAGLLLIINNYTYSKSKFPHEETGSSVSNGSIIRISS